MVGFITGDQAISLSDLSKEERRVLISNHYATLFNDERMKESIDYMEKDWVKEEYSDGCYVSNCPPGLITSPSGPTIRQREGIIHFCGTETAEIWNGF